MKKTLSLLLILTTLVSMFSFFTLSTSAATTYDASKLASKAESYLGSDWKKGLCLNFVANMVQQTYSTKYDSKCCAYKYGSMYIDSTSQDNIPIGADVFFTGSTSTCKKCKNKCGHVGIYIGDGYIVHNWSGKIQKHKISEIHNKKSYDFRGWGWHGNMSFTSTNSSANTTEANLKTGKWYTFTNIKSNKLLNVYGSRSKSNTNVTVYQKDGTTGQSFKLVEHGTKSFKGKTYIKYTIIAKCASSCALNVYGNSSKNGSNVNIWTKSGNSTQDWIFEPVNGGYVIRSANNTNYVLTASGTANSSNVKLQTYSSGNTYQIWKLS